MIKLRSIFLIIAITFVFNCQYKSNDFPQIQNILFNSESTNRVFSQKISKNSFTIVEISSISGKTIKTVYHDIDWSSFTNVAIHSDSSKSTKEILEYGFYFFPKLKYTVYNEDKRKLSTGLNREFKCYINKKDRNKFLKIVYEWKKKQINKSKM
jgi:hypothetical protein